jgi:hypothetical protein
VKRHSNGVAIALCSNERGAVQGRRAVHTRGPCPRRSRGSRSRGTTTSNPRWRIANTDASDGSSWRVRSRVVMTTVADCASDPPSLRRAWRAASPPGRPASVSRDGATSPSARRWSAISRASSDPPSPPRSPASPIGWPYSRSRTEARRYSRRVSASLDAMPVSGCPSSIWQTRAARMEPRPDPIHGRLGATTCRLSNDPSVSPR